MKNIQALWRAVILQALIDATSNYKRREYQLEKEKARSWLLCMSDSFVDVCSMAGYEPHYVQKKAKFILESKRNAIILHTSDVELSKSK